MAQVPADSNLDFPGPPSFYEYGSAPFAEGEPSKTHGLWPFAPGHVGSYAQPFAPARTSTFGNGPRPNEGHWFSYERLFWSLSKPTTAIIGSTSAAPPDLNTFIDLNDPFGLSPPYPALNTVDTGKFTANGAWGNRWELGYMDDTNYGYEVSVLDHVQQSQYHIDNGVQMQFDDPGNLLLASVLVTIDDAQFLLDIGKMGVQFDELTQQQITTLNGVEAMRTYRAPRLHRGGFFEVLYGVRWFQMQDAYIVAGTNFDEFDLFFNPLADSQWSTVVQNNLVGPQIGLRWFNQRGRFVSSVETRFLAAANFQNVKLKTRLGDEAALFVSLFDETEGVAVTRRFLGLGTDQHDFATTFAPMGELRVGLAYNCTSKVALKVGYTGMVVGGITRASNRLRYDQDKLITLKDSNEHQTFWVNGLNFGVEVNR
ncbi:MAG: BBP7 family outer membrane beta-barrel protein [Pirellulales bacterium]